MKIGLLGGSFDPPHKGHIHISLQSAKKMGLEQVWWLPAKQNPLKFFCPQSDFKDRISQCEQIIKSHPQIMTNDLELKIKSFYTIDLLQELVKKYPEHQFFWIMGADNILQFHLWKQWQKIIDIVYLIVCDRDDFFDKAIKSEGFLWAKKCNKISFLKIKKLAISSTSIRKKNES